MSDHRWRNGFALGLTAGILGTIIVSLLLEVYPSEHAKPNPESDESSQIQPTDNRWWLIPKVLFVEDTAAQWLMTLLTLAAVALVYLTLRETRQTLIDTRRIGEAQARAYPSVTSVSLSGVTNGLPEISVTVKNSGASPALNMKSRGRLMLSWQSEPTPSGLVQQLGAEVNVLGRAQVSIPPSANGRVAVYAPPDDSENAKLRREMMSNSRCRNPHWSAQIHFDWVDVFGQKFNFYIVAQQVRASNDYAISDDTFSTPFEIAYQSQSEETKPS